MVYWAWPFPSLFMSSHVLSSTISSLMNSHHDAICHVGKLCPSPELSKCRQHAIVISKLHQINFSLYVAQYQAFNYSNTKWTISMVQYQKNYSIRRQQVLAQASFWEDLNPCSQAQGTHEVPREQLSYSSLWFNRCKGLEVLNCQPTPKQCW